MLKFCWDCTNRTDVSENAMMVLRFAFPVLIVLMFYKFVVGAAL